MKEVATKHASVDMRIASISVAIPVSVYVMTLWIIRDRFHFGSAVRLIMPGAALLILVAGIVMTESVSVIAFILVMTLVLRRAAQID